MSAIPAGQRDVTDITPEPTDDGHRTDMGFPYPFGNSIRSQQMKPRKEAPA